MLLVYQLSFFLWPFFPIFTFFLLETQQKMATKLGAQDYNYPISQHHVRDTILAMVNLKLLFIFFSSVFFSFSFLRLFLCLPIVLDGFLFFFRFGLGLQLFGCMLVIWIHQGTLRWDELKNELFKIWQWFKN